MRFGVLGPLAAWTEDGRPVKIGERKVRALLAHLLVHAGRPVSADRLIDDLWGEQLPRNPINTLHTRVSQLRRALAAAEPDSRDLVVSQQPGYLLRVRADALDANRFAELTAQALVVEEPQARVMLLAEALALWRGDALADFADEPFAASAALRWEEARLAAVEAQADARLLLGEHNLVAAELGELVARFPLRERLRAVHLRALYRAGRQGEALAGYRDLRDRLAGELGVDPSPGLVALHEAFLRQDRALDATSTPSTSVARPRTNLPVALTDLVGRQDAVPAVRGMLATGRLVTLIGPGGVGKTQLALEVARQWRDSVDEDVWLVELSALPRAIGEDARAVAEVAGAVATTLQIRDDGTAPRLDLPADPARRLAGALRDARVLLVLDNCEHVVEAVAGLVESVLKAAADVRVLATSREPLGVSGETVWTVPALPLPGPDVADPGDVAQLRRFGAVALFVDRAAAAVPGFVLDTDTAEPVVRICRQLDGIPLALELAATRVRALGVHELADRLHDRFRVLVAGRRGAPARQRTLRAVIDWSWEPLNEPERIVLRRLAVPAEGCTLDAAEAICAEAGFDVVDVLTRLVDRSLVVRVQGGEVSRYRLLESVKAYCVDRLREAGESESVRYRHLRYYTALAERAERQLYGPDQRRWLLLLDAEWAELSAALDSAVALGATEHALRIVNSLAWYWFLRGRLTEACRAFGLALDGIDVANTARTARARAWRTGMALLTSEGDPRARDPALLRSADAIADPADRARAQWFLCLAHRGFGDLGTTTALATTALAAFRELDDDWGRAAALAVRATVSRARGELVAAGRDAEDSAAVFRELGDRWGQLKAATTLSELAEIEGDYERAARLHREGLRKAEELELWSEASLRLSGLGRISLMHGDFPAAEEFHVRAMRLAAGQSDTVAEEFAEIGLALGARRQGRLDVAEGHLRRWLDWLGQVDGEPGLALVLAELGFVAEQRGDAQAAFTLHQDGLVAARKIGDPRAVALALEGLAGAHSIAGRPREATRLLATATSVRESIGAPLPAAERHDVDRIIARIRAELGDEDYAAEFDRNAAASTEFAGYPSSGAAVDDGLGGDAVGLEVGEHEAAEAGAEKQTGQEGAQAGPARVVDDAVVGGLVVEGSHEDGVG